MSTNGTKPSAEWELITPDVAEQLLKMNDNNRKVRVYRVSKYARAISLDDWGLTGQPIIIDWNGKLMDGQHRLMAVVETKASIWMLVVRGVDPKLFPLIDKGAARTAGDAFTWAGIQHANMSSAALRNLIAILQNKKALRDPMTINSITDQELLDAYQLHKATITWAAPLSARVSSAIKLPPAKYLTAVLLLTLDDCDPESIQSFTDQLVTGANLAEGSPILALRNWALNVKATKRSLRKDEVIIAVLKAWNDVGQDRQRRMMTVKPDELIPAVMSR
jgi:hypothetical protein